MAIYDLGTASLAANGEVTGVGTAWKAPLTLIRVGATILFKTEPVQIYTISEIISDTQINVYNPNSETVPAGTGYAILAHDGITVQGLAQDVAETLRYYQSRETEVADAVDAFNNFDPADFESKVAQVSTQHGDVVSIGEQVSSDAAQVSLDKDSASASALSATNSQNAAAVSAQEAANSAASIQPENFTPVLFSTGGTINRRGQTAIYLNNGYCGEYIWNGSIPKAIPQDSTPYTTGGFSSSAWVKINGDMKFEDFGAIGDGLTDDSPAISRARDWFASGVNGNYITTSSDRVYLMNSTVDFDFFNKSGFKMILNSPIRPSSSASIGIKIQNVRDSIFKLSVNGGGHPDDTYLTKGNPNYVDYTTASPAGALTAFVIRGTRNCVVDVDGVNYKGRVLSTLGIDTSTTGRIKQSFITLNVLTGDASSVSNGRCGQAFYLTSDDSAYGKIERAFINWDYFGSVIEDVADIAIGHIEFGANGNSGFEFRGIATANISTLSGGDETNTNDVLTFKNSASGKECIGVNIDRIFVLRGLNGVVFNGSNGAASGSRQNFTVGSIYSQGNSRSGLVASGCNNSTFDKVQLQENGYGVEMRRVNRNVTFRSLNSLSSVYSPVVSVAESNNSGIFFERCRFIGNSGSPCMNLLNGAIGKITARDCQFSSSFGVFVLPSSSSVRIFGGEIMDLSPLYGTGNLSPAVTVKDLDGYKTLGIGSSSIGAGVQQVVINHGLAIAPSFVSITPSTGSLFARVISIDSTSFTVRLNNSVPTGDTYNFTWSASAEI